MCIEGGGGRLVSIETFKTLLFVQSGHSKLYCLCNRDIQNFIVCAIGTFQTFLFVQSGHSKLYCLCNRDIPNFIVCAIGTFQTLLFVQSGHSKLYCLRYRDIQNFIVCAIDTFKTLLFACPFWGCIELRIEIEKSASHRLAWHQNEHQARGSH